MNAALKSGLERLLQGRRPRRLTIEGTRDAAILIPVIGSPEPALVFTVRTETLSTHKGQISFPGGSIDPGDGSPMEAALRETQEEIGLVPEAVTILGELDAVPTFVTGYVVAPVVGWLDETPAFVPNPREVAAVLEVPLGDLVDDIRTEPGFTHSGRTFPTEAWIWNDHVIWGVTARILRMFLTLLGEAGLVSPPGATASWSAWPLPAPGP